MGGAMNVNEDLEFLMTEQQRALRAVRGLQPGETFNEVLGRWQNNDPTRVVIDLRGGLEDLVLDYIEQTPLPEKVRFGWKNFAILFDVMCDLQREVKLSEAIEFSMSCCAVYREMPQNSLAHVRDKDGQPCPYNPTSVHDVKLVGEIVSKQPNRWTQAFGLGHWTLVLEADTGTWIPMDVPQGIQLADDEFAEKNVPAIREYALRVSWGLTSMLSAVKNIELSEPQLPSRPERRRSARSGSRSGGIIYTTLAVRVGKTAQAIKFGKGGRKDLGQKRLHQVRGHFSTYTDAAPLFGRAVGTFWIPPHMRGVASLGSTRQTIKKGVVR